jgi:ATP-dependent DNA helicase RecQ
MKISSALKIPISNKLKKIAVTSPQKIFQSNISKKENVKDKFIYEDIRELIGKKILLIDDIFDSGCTIKEIGRYLTLHGAMIIAPLVIAKTVGGDVQN